MESMFLRCILFSIAWAGLAVAGQESSNDSSRPSAQQQNEMLAAMARFAEHYISNLPNFICLQTTEQYQGNKKGDHWKKGDTLAMRLAYSDRNEHRTLEEVNNKPIENRSRGWRHPMRTEGEFGALLANVFSDSSNASFEWNRWDTLNGHRVAVFDYKIDREHSLTKLSDTYVHDITVATEGSVFADPETGNVLKISSNVSDIPSELMQREARTVVTYDYVTIGTSKYLLPSRTTVIMRTNSGAMRNESTYRDYKKFEAESTLKFDSSDSNSSPPPK